jgi:hypothetical protein
VNVIKLEEYAAETLKLREEVKRSQKRLEELTDILKAFAGSEKKFQAGKYTVLISERSRTDLDKKALVCELGDKLKAFEKITTYKILEVK